MGLLLIVTVLVVVWVGSYRLGQHLGDYLRALWLKRGQ